MNYVIDKIAQPQVFWPLLAISLLIGMGSCLHGWERMERNADEFMTACEGDLQACRNACAVEHIHAGRNDGTVRHCLNWEPDND